MAADERKRWRAGIVTLVLTLLVGGCAGPSLQPLTPGGVEDRAASTERMFRMAESAAQAGDLGTAATLLDQVVRAQPKNVQAMRRLGDVLLRQERPREASEAYMGALRQAYGDREASIGYAKSMIAIGRMEAAMAHVEPLLEKYPEDLKVINLAAVVHDMQGNHAEAAKLYRRGLFIDPGSVSMNNNLGLSLALAGDAEGALGILKPLAEGAESTARIRQNLALAYGVAGDVVAARSLSGLDLSAEEVTNNLAYYSGIRAMAPSQARSAILAPDVSTPSATPLRETGINVVVGIGAGGESVTVAPSLSTRWFVDLGTFTTQNKAQAHWDRLRNRFGDITDGLASLARGGDGSAPLLVGPVADADSADRLCRVLSETQDTKCVPVRL